MNLTKTQIDSAKNVECEKCNSPVMTQIYVVKKISGLLMPDGKDTFLPIPAFACQKCGHVNDLFANELGINKKE